MYPHRPFSSLAFLAIQDPDPSPPDLFIFQIPLTHELKQELSSTHQDLRHLASISHKIKAEKDAEVTEVLERSIKVEAEYRMVEAFKGKLKGVREDVEKLSVEKEELSSQLNVGNGEIEGTKLELGYLG